MTLLLMGEVLTVQRYCPRSDHRMSLICRFHSLSSCRTTLNRLSSTIVLSPYVRGTEALSTQATCTHVQLITPRLQLRLIRPAVISYKQVQRERFGGQDQETRCLERDVGGIEGAGNGNCNCNDNISNAPPIQADRRRITYM